MTKQMRCWQCGGELSVDVEMVGAHVNCTHCSASVPVPEELFGEPIASPTSQRGQHTAGNSPIGAAFLNFFFWGAGYVYLGRVWGLWLLIPFCILVGKGMATSSAHTRSTVTIFLLNFVGLFLAVHAYGMAKKDR